ncbi:MAG: hypothetical protein KUL82_00040 [Bdellovibrio sp.]|nr:hypothetical protein [Bdellovibrio sp.]
MEYYRIKEVLLELNLPPTNEWRAPLLRDFFAFAEITGSVPKKIVQIEVIDSVVPSTRRRNKFLFQKQKRVTNLRFEVLVGRTPCGIQATVLLYQAEGFYSDLYKLIHSLVGEMLEDLGYVRLHAALFIENERWCLLESPPGFGKSTRCLRVLKDGGRVFTDEYVLFKDGEVFPLAFPLSVERGNPLLLSFVGHEGFKEMNANKVILKTNLLAQTDKASLDVLLVPRQGFFRVRFLFRVLLGIGNIQMIHYRVRADSLKGLALGALRRTWAGLWLLFHVPVQTVPKLSTEKNLQSPQQELSSSQLKVDHST